VKLYLLRHAEAVPRGTARFRRDCDRPLTKDGLRQIRRVARGLRRLHCEFDVILSSPYKRARHTAEITATILEQSDRLELTNTLVSHASPGEVIALINQAYANCERILLVGHEPHLSTLTARLLGNRDHATLEMKKGGLCRLACEKVRDAACARLDWWLTPRQLELIGKT
jgi:phosphohistidine phosphatase